MTPFHSLKMDAKELGGLIEQFEVYSIFDDAFCVDVIKEEQFKDMIGVLGSFYIGERIFKVVLQLSKHNEAKFYE